MEILICGLNGTGKSTLGRMPADRLEYGFIRKKEVRLSLGYFFHKEPRRW